MNHGRFSFLAAWAVLTLRTAAQNPPATAAADPAPAQLPIQLSWIEPDHLSAIYHVKADARLAIMAQNTSREPADLTGEILFGQRGEKEFKPLSVTPIAPATLAPGQRVRIPLAVTFGAAGGYELRFHQGDSVVVIEGPGAHSGDRKLQCIFAPRTAIVPADTRGDSPWITTLPPQAAATPGLLTDYIAQTSVRRFLIDEQFSYDPAANVGLGFGASTGATARQIDALLAEAVKAKASLTLRVTVPLDTDPDTVLKSIDAFRKYIDDAARRSKGTLDAIAIAPATRRGTTLSDAQKSLFHSYYLAGRDAAKKADKDILLLGPGSAALAADIFQARDAKLGSIDALAIADASFEPLIAATLLADRKIPLQILPPPSPDSATPAAWPCAAAALAGRAVVVPVPPPEFDNGVTAHLLGGATFTQRLRLSMPSKNPAAPYTTAVPFIAVFQGNGFSVAAIAGPGARTELDGLYPGLAAAPSRVTGEKEEPGPATANLEVSDDSHAMRVVDEQGAAVDCRVGDSLYVPAINEPAYLLEAASADELAGSLRTATPHHLPQFEVTATRVNAQTLKVTLRNVSTRELSGKMSVNVPALAPGTIGSSVREGAPGSRVSEAVVPLVAPGKTADIPVDFQATVLAGDPPPGRDFDIEIVTAGPHPATQRSTVHVTAK